MKGGFIVSPKQPLNNAIEFFKNNCRFEILTNGSIACITFRMILNDGVVSPFKHVRSGLFGKEVRILLAKFFPCPHLDIHTFHTQMYVPGRRGIEQTIELTTNDNIIKEYNIQLHVYKKTYITEDSLYESVCPYPVKYFIDLPISNTLDFIQNNLIPRQGRDINAERNEIRLTLGNTTYVNSLSLILMEFMDGFDTYDNVIHTLPRDRRAFFSSLMKYEIDRLHKYASIYHVDKHGGNYMVSLTYPYLSTGPHDLGRLLIIDFGKSVPSQQVDPNDQTMNEGGNYVAPYTYDNITERRQIMLSAFNAYMHARGARAGREVQYPQNFGGSNSEKLSKNNIFQNKKYDMKILTNGKTPEELIYLIKTHLQILSLNEKVSSNKFMENNVEKIENDGLWKSKSKNHISYMRRQKHIPKQHAHTKSLLSKSRSKSRSKSLSKSRSKLMSKLRSKSRFTLKKN